MTTTACLRLLAHAALLAAVPPAALAQPSAATADHVYRSQPVPGRYIVVFRDGVDRPAETAAALARGAGGQLHHSYGNALRGFSLSLPEAALQGLRHHPAVAFVEQDQRVSLQQLASPEQQAPWGLDRIDQADRPLDTLYHFDRTGAGVHAFVLDTGIRPDHVEFSGRLRPGFSTVADGNGTADCHGHGTHVAGTLGGTVYGVAKQVALVPVRVLDCTGNGLWSDVIAGLDWVAASTARPAVANLSLGGTASAAVDAAVANLAARGVTVVVAAGNSGVDACTASPAREPSALTVGATASDDWRAYYSNVGSCLDLFAPGTGIPSASHAGPQATATRSGTSMAAPHVAGAAALLLETTPGASPAAIAAALLANATRDRIPPAGIGAGSPNLLLSTAASTAPAPQPVTQTVAVRSLSGAGVRNGGQWKASVTVAVRDVASGAAVPNATVSGSFSPGGAASCVTSAAGSCTLASGALKAGAVASTTFVATGVAGSLLRYDASQNAATQIVVTRP